MTILDGPLGDWPTKFVGPFCTRNIKCLIWVNYWAVRQSPNLGSNAALVLFCTLLIKWIGTYLYNILVDY